MVGGASAPPTTLRQYPGPMQELYGDSARGADWAAVRLRVQDGRILDADAPGIDTDLRGLTLLEACAVGGETLPVDALANALAPAVRAAPDPGRVAVAMSGGVDSAVTLLKAGPSAVGVTLRLWLDPNGPDAERACCSPSAVLAARQSCHARGLPHVTLDRREAFRRAVVTPFVRGYARGETPNPCTRCNGGFRFAELLVVREPRRRSGACDGPLRADRGARRAAAARAWRRSEQGSELHARPPGASSPLADSFPPRSADQGGDAGRSRCRRARGGAPRREPGGVLPRGRRLSLLPRPTRAVCNSGCDRRRGRRAARRAPRLLAVHARPTAWSRRRGSRAAVRRFHRRPHEHGGRSGRAPPSRAPASSARGQVYAPVSRVTAKLRYRSPAVPATVEATATGFRLQLDEPAYGVARGQAAVLYDGDVVVGSGLVTSAAAG